MPPVEKNNSNRRQFLRRLTSGGALAGMAMTGFATPAWLGGDMTFADEPDAAAQPKPAPAESPWKIGCFTRPFSEFTYAETLNAIAAAGYGSVGLMTVKLPTASVTLADATAAQAEAIGKQAADHGLAVSATYYGGPPVRQSVAEGTAALRQLIDNCRRAGCTSVVLGGTGEAAIFDRYFEAIRTVCDLAAENNVELVIKPHGGLNATGPQCREIIRRVDHPAFRMWYDPGNIFYYSEGKLDPLDDVASVAGLVTGMCVKDFRPPQEVSINPGSGQVRFAELMSRLQAGGFRGGPLVVETLAPGDLATVTANARNAREFLAGLVA